MVEDFVNFLPIIRTTRIRVETIEQVQQVMHTLQFVIQNCLLIEMFTEARSGEIYIYAYIQTNLFFFSFCVIEDN